MKKCAWLLFACLTGAALALPGSVQVQVDLASRYIWRGFDLLPDNHPAIQPSMTIDLGKSGFSINIWGSFALEQRGTFKTSDEIDITFAYDFRMPEGWEMSAGFIDYNCFFADKFNFKDNTTQEIFAIVAKTDLPLSPRLSVYYDFNLGSGLYVTLGGSHELNVSEKASVEIGGLVGFNSRQYIDKTGFSDIGLYVKAPVALGRVLLTPSLNAMVPLMDEVNEDVEVWFGFSAAF